MTATTIILLAVAILLLATLYSSVGHAGASGYLAAMALVTQLPPEEMKAIALSLNIFVGSIATWQFVRAGHFDWNTFWPFGLIAIPMAFLGGLWSLPKALFNPLIAAVLLLAAGLLIARVVRSRSKHKPPAKAIAMPPLPVALVAGGLLGLLAGLTGTGGGIFLSPLLLLLGWADPQRTAAVSVVFVLANSIAGLGGVFVESPTLPSAMWIFIIVAIVGGLWGAHVGANRLPGDAIRVLLGAVLIIAAIKMIVTAVDPTGPSTRQATPEVSHGVSKTSITPSHLLLTHPPGIGTVFQTDFNMDHRWPVPHRSQIAPA